MLLAPAGLRLGHMHCSPIESDGHVPRGGTHCTGRARATHDARSFLTPVLRPQAQRCPLAVARSVGAVCFKFQERPVRTAEIHNEPPIAFQPSSRLNLAPALTMPCTTHVSKHTCATDSINYNLADGSDSIIVTLVQRTTTSVPASQSISHGMHASMPASTPCMTDSSYCAYRTCLVMHLLTASVFHIFSDPRAHRICGFSSKLLYRLTHNLLYCHY